MRKVQLAILMFFLSFQVGSVIPDANPQWSRVKDVMFESPSAITTGGYNVRVRLYYTDAIRMDIIVANGNGSVADVCEVLEKHGFDGNDINGRKVVLHGECLGNDGVRLWPKYRNQTKYAIDEFLTKDRVHLGGAPITTEGFVDAYGEVRRFASFME